MEHLHSTLIKYKALKEAKQYEAEQDLHSTLIKYKVFSLVKFTIPISSFTFHSD